MLFSLNINKLYRGSGLIHKSPGQITIRINPPIAQERPVCAAELDLVKIAGNHQDLLLID